jgi:solute carrier family 13 (sodium-dependent dicarboxylate transporter), member 2/3/5
MRPRGVTAYARAAASVQPLDGVRGWSARAAPDILPGMPSDPSSPAEPRLGLRGRIGLPLGPVLFAAMLLTPPPAELGQAGWHAAAVGVLMATWWVTEAVPIPATALLPIALFPLLDVRSIDGAAAPYANPLIFLFMGGFLLALAMQRWELHRRIALSVLRLAGTRPAGLVWGFMVATAVLSMWVSNTATAVMMLPIGFSVVQLVEANAARGGGAPARSNFAVALVLGIAYAASIGGLATLIGTPPNALVAGFLRETYGVEIGFATWMMVGLPLTVVLLPLTWVLLTRLVFPVRDPEIPGGRALIAGELRKLGPVARAEWIVMAVFALAAGSWIFRPLLDRAFPGLGLTDAGIAIAAALLLFAAPVDLGRGVFVLNWEWANRLPWEVLVLFGGGLSLADALTETGVARWIGGEMAAVGHLPTMVVVLMVVAVIIFLSELASNTATAAAFLPVVAALAVGIGENPLLLTIPAALAATCGFMLPVATPPNAIAYGTGRVTVPQMARAGWWLDLVSIVVVLAVAYFLVPVVFGIEPGVVPDWAAGR